MKGLSSVNKEDALQILFAGYPLIIATATWNLTEHHLDAPAKLLTARSKEVLFWFFDDGISINYTDESYEKDAINFNDTYFDCNVNCYVKAVLMGYHVPQFEPLLIN